MRSPAYVLVVAVRLGLALAAFVPRGAGATPILDTYPADGNLWKPIAIAVPFGPLGPENVVASIMAAVRGSMGSVEIGIMTDAAGLPSDNFLFSRTVIPTLSADLMLTGLDWQLPSHVPLWLAVRESPAFSFGDGFWQGNATSNSPWAFKATLDGAWFPFTLQVPAARVDLADLPEPGWSWLGYAVALGVVALRRRPRAG